MFSFGDNVLESPCVTGGSVIGRVSVADASLSLSLSLWAGRRLAARPTRRGFSPRPAEPQGSAWSFARCRRVFSFLFFCRRGPCARGGFVLPACGSDLVSSL